MTESSEMTMDRLPAEIQRLICSNLHKPIDVENMRLVNKNLSAAASEYFLYEVCLIFTNESFKRLDTISQHPVYSKRVRCLHYQPDALDAYTGYVHWLRDASQDSPPAPSKRAAILGWQEQHLKAYDKYLSYFQDQEDIRRRDYNGGLIAEIMSRLPNLVEVTINFENAFLVNMNTNGMSDAFKDCFLDVGGDFDYGSSFDVRQLRSILLGANTAATKLKILQATVCWDFVLLSDSDVETYTPAFQNLTMLGLSFRPDDSMEFSDTNPESLTKKRFQSLLGAIRKLRRLDITFPFNRGFFLPVEQLVGNTTWPQMEIVKFKFVDFTEDGLVRFLRNNSNSLQDISFEDLHLLDGDWITALPKIRKCVKWNKLHFGGNLTSDDPQLLEGQHGAYWCVGWKTDRGLATAVEKYVMHGGDNPLLDSETYPMAKF